MKKALYILSAAALVFASCDPVSEDKDFSFIVTSNETLSSESFLSLKQANKAGEPQADGNYFTYTTNPATVVDLFYLNKDNARVFLTKKAAASGTFELSPKRGSSSQQDIYIRVANPDGTENVGKRTVTVYVAQELAPEIKLIASNYGKKTWKWVSGARCWGNCDQSGATLPDVGGEWWGCDTPEDLLTQLQHSGGAEHGDESADAYMIFTEDGVVTSYRPDGTVIRSSAYKINDYTEELHGYDYDAHGADNAGLAVHKDNWTHGVLTTDEAGILFPYLINEGGEAATKFQISKLTTDKMILTAACHRWQDWGGETTYWRFTSESDAEGLISNYSSKSWKWVEGARCWGNCDQSGATLPDVGGEWWGCDTPEQLLDQLQHGTGSAQGEEATGAYMTFENGTVTSYTPEGNKIRSAEYKIVDPELYDGTLKGYDYDAQGADNAGLAVHKDNWTRGQLTTEGAGILFPYLINEGGEVATKYQISKLTGDLMILTAACHRWQDWGGETTYWRFQVKE